MSDWNAPPEYGIALALLVGARTGALVFASPLPVAAAPYTVRIGAATVLTLALAASLWGAPLPALDDLSAFAPAFVGELVIGAALGLAVQFVTAGLQAGGSLVATLGGFHPTPLYDPLSEEETSAPAVWIGLATTAALFVSGGHRQVVAALADGFALVPPGAAVLGSTVAPLTDVASLSAGMFWLALRLAAPVAAATLAVLALLALAGRVLAPLPLGDVAPPLQTALALVLIALSLDAWGGAAEESLTAALAAINESLAGVETPASAAPALSPSPSLIPSSPAIAPSASLVP
ncbi:MAG TPA: flagellar biosynthetic protein FliR [Pirellulales bacterium]